MKIKDLKASGILIWQSRLIEVKVPLVLLFLDVICWAKDFQVFWEEMAQGAEIAGMWKERRDFRKKARVIREEVIKAEADPNYRLQFDKMFTFRTSIKPWQVHTREDLDEYVSKIMEHTSKPNKGDVFTFIWIIDEMMALDGVPTLFATAGHRDAVACTGKIVRGVLVDQAHLQALNRAARQKFGR